VLEQAAAVVGVDSKCNRAELEKRLLKFADLYANMFNTPRPFNSDPEFLTMLSPFAGTNETDIAVYVLYHL
jgi:hypothetical protein